MAYRVLLMDADETLLDFRRAERHALEETLRSIGVIMTREMHDLYHDINRVLWQQLETGDITRERLKVCRFERFLSDIGVSNVDAGAVNAQYMGRIGTCGFVLPGALACLAALTERYTVHLITNGTASVQHTRLAASGLLDYVERVFVSEEIGADKPSPVFFQHVRRELGDPDTSDLLIIGDSLTSDIRGGQLSGIDTCWFNPNKLSPSSDIVPTYTVASFNELLELLK